MTNQAIISLAILKVNWDVLGKDYFENFVPLVAECIRISQNDVVSLPDLQVELQKQFGLTIPQNAIKSILGRLQKRGYIHAENKVYQRNNDKLDELNFHNIQQKVLRMHEAVIAHLTKFCKDRFGITWSLEDAESAFQSYIEENQLPIVSFSKGVTPIIYSLLQPIKGSKYIVGAFIQHLQDTFASDFEYLETIVKGNLLANAIFLADPNQVSRKFRKTEVYFDTSFLIFALGHAGKARKAPCLELLELLYENGAELKCFKHTVDEVRGVLEACAHRIRHKQLREAYGPSIEYFISAGFTASDIELLLINLERDLASQRIRVVEKPAYISEYVIDEKKFSDMLIRNISYHNLQAPQRDVDSVSAIMRLRRGQEFFFLEECKALFVTTNNALVRFSRDFFYQESTLGAVPPCLPDYVLTNLLWLKKPLKAPDLPRKKVIADYYAAIQPEERLWVRYLAEIDKLEQIGRFTADDYYLLRYSLEAKSALMEITLGEEAVFTEGTPMEILTLVRSQIQQEKDAEISKQIELRKAAEKEVENVNARDRDRLSQIKFRSQQYAKFIAKMLQYIGLIALIVGTISTFPWNLPTLNEKPFSYLLPLIQIGLLILSIGNLMFGTTLESCIRKVEIKLAKWLEMKFLKMLE